MRARLFFLSCVMLFGGVSYGGHLELYRRLCFEEIVVIDDPRVHIPVGCEVIDCCPGCPGPPIDWHIVVQGDPLRSLDFVFENLTPQIQQNLKLSNNAKWINSNTLRVNAGTTVIRGFPA